MMSSPVRSRSICSCVSGQAFVIDNLPGAGSTIGSKAVAVAKADGYTLLIGSTSTLAISSVLYPNAGYDPVKSFAPIAAMGGIPQLVVVNPSVPADTLQALVAYAKLNPDRLRFGFGLGTCIHLLGEYFKVVSGTAISSIPYRASAQALPDLLSGRIDMGIGPATTLLPLIKQQKLKPLAYSGPKRSTHLPDVPTMIEAEFPQLTEDCSLGVLGPSALPIAIVEQLNREINQSSESAELQASFDKLGFEPRIMSPSNFGAFITTELQKWPTIVKAAKIMLEQ